MSQIIDTKKEFSLMKRGKSFVNAGRGLKVFWQTTPNAWIQTTLAILAIVLGLYFQIDKLEWFMLIIAIGSVLTAESFNTAIEIDINLTSPNQHPYARDTKDVAAGAVLIVSITAAIIGLVVFWPHIINFCF